LPPSTLPLGQRTASLASIASNGPRQSIVTVHQSNGNQGDEGLKQQARPFERADI
jgi:hypothetical protein